MEVKEVKLLDGSGGLNNRDQPSQIQINEFSKLENLLTDEGGWPGKKRLGQLLMQYAPIDPSEEVIDANTMALYHLDDATGFFVFANAVAGVAMLTDGGNTRTAALLPTATPYGQRFFAPSMTRPQPDAGHITFPGTPQWGIDGKSAVCFRGWLNILPSFNGAPINIAPPMAPYPYVTYQTGATLFSTQKALMGMTNRCFGAINGFTIHRDWDDVAGVSTSDPYLKFHLRFNGSAGIQVIDLVSGYLPTSAQLFIQGDWDQATSKMRILVNGTVTAEVIVPGTGNVIYDGLIPTDGAFTMGAAIGGHDNVNVPFSPSSYARFQGDYILDEVSVSDVVRTDTPFKEPRGKPWPLVKADGTRQLIVGAGDGLYYTVGDGAWVKMNDAAHDVLGAETFSTIADWDAVQIEDGLFLQNGADSPKLWEGAKLWPWGEAVTALIPTRVAAGAGLGYIGAVSYYQTFLYGTFETGPSPIAAVVLTALTDQVDIGGIPIGPIPCTGRRIYRVKATGPDAGKLYLLRQINNNVTTALTGAFVGSGDPNTDAGRDGLPDATLGTGSYVEMTALVRFTKTPKAKYTLANQNRAWLAGNPDDQYSAFYSERDTPHVFLPVNFVTANADAGPLIGLAKYYGETHASKGGKSTLVLRGDNPSNWQQFEVLHPTIGAIDHWSYVHRTIPQSDSYRLCFWGQDGAYAYAGQDFEKISDLIIGTTNGLISDNGNKLAVTVTTRNDWEAAPGNSGSITTNAYQPRYEQDGTRQVPGQIRSVDQLDYVGLWNPNTPPAPTLANVRVIAVCKGLNEGEFYFSTDDTNDLWFTPDNFLSAASVGITSLNIVERIIEIVQRGSDNYFFLFLDEASPDGVSSAGGRVFSWDGAVFTNVWAGLLYYNADTRMIAKGNPFGPVNSGGTVFTSPASPNNAFVTHPQTVRINGQVNGYQTVSHVYKPASITDPGAGGNFYAGSPNLGPGVFNWDVFLNASGFYTLAPNDNTGVANTSYSHRKFPLWRGGSFRPNAYWDATNSRFVFLASDAPDANGNCIPKLHTLNSAGTVHTAAVSDVTAFTTDGVNVWFWQTATNAAGGFVGTMRRSTLATPWVTVASGAGQNNLYALRLAYNSADAVKFLGTFKDWNNGTQNYWAYKGTIQSIPFATLNPTSLQAKAVNGDSGPFYCELVAQPTAPQSWFTAVNKISATDTSAFHYVLAGTAIVGTTKNTPYTGNDALAAATGLRSNLLFVAASGAPNYLWADRLYFFTDAAAVLNERMVQLGVPGTWRVIVDYVSAAFQTAGFAAFDDLTSDYQGNISFYLRNAAALVGLPASEKVVTPNSAINNFPAPLSIFQFRLSLVWDYMISATPVYSEFVQIGYFTGSANLPRVVGWHWKGRTCWAVAEVGQARNNLVCVYQKSGKWTTYTGWRIKGTAEFLGKLVALQDYSLVQIETGNKDLGNLIRTKARTGYIMDSAQDKCIRDVKFNLQSYVNNNFPTKNGYMKLVPYGADTRLPADWVFPIPATPAVEPRQVLALPTQSSFPYQYARAFAVELLTSDDTGAYAPTVDQVESLAGLIMRLFVSSDRETIVRP